MEQFDWKEIKDCKVGDIIVWRDGAEYKLEKKTTTAIAISRYRWYNKLFDKLFNTEENVGI